VKFLEEEGEEREKRGRREGGPVARRAGHIKVPPSHIGSKQTKQALQCGQQLLLNVVV